MTAQRIVTDVRRALGYLAEAARLVRRHPSLLLLPVVVAVFNVGESQLGQHLVLQRTAYGRWLRERIKELPRPPAPDSRTRVVRVETPGAMSVPTMPLSGVSALIGAVVTGRPHGTGLRSAPWPNLLLMLMALSLSLLLLAPVNALVRGGYFGLLVEAASTDKANAACFARSAARFFLRFWLLLALLAVAYLTFFSILFPVLGASDVGWALLRGAGWLMVAGVFLLMLVSSALVWEDSSLWTAVGRSVITVVRDLAVALPLFVVAVAAENVFAWLFQWVRSWTWQQPEPAGFMPWSNVLTDAGQRCVLALVGAWLAVAIVLWYRDASARLWPRVEEGAPAGGEPAIGGAG